MKLPWVARDERGGAILVVMAFLVFVVPTVTAALSFAATVSLGSGARTESVIAQYTSTGGAEHGLYRVVYEAGYADGLVLDVPDVYTVPINGRTVDVSVTKAFGHGARPTRINLQQQPASLRREGRHPGNGLAQHAHYLHLHPRCIRFSCGAVSKRQDSPTYRRTADGGYNSSSGMLPTRVATTMAMRHPFRENSVEASPRPVISSRRQQLALAAKAVQTSRALTKAAREQILASPL